LAITASTSRILSTTKNLFSRITALWSHRLGSLMRQGKQNKRWTVE
jgi:hypothetical protein